MYVRNQLFTNWKMHQKHPVYEDESALEEKWH